MAVRLKEFLYTKNRIIIVYSAIIVFVGIVIFRNWIFTCEWPGGGDALGWISKAYVWRDLRWIYVWRDYSFGFVEGVAMDLKNLLFIGLFSVVADAPTTVKIFMFGSFVTAGFSMYAFAYRYTRRHTAALAASLIYVLNPWLFSQFTEAHADIIFSYALAPLVFLTLDRMLKAGKLRNILSFALGLWVVLTAFHLEFTAIYGIFLVLFVLFYVLFPSEQKLFMRVKRSLKTFFPACLIALSLSAFSLVPFALNTVSPYLSPSYGYPLEYSYTGTYSNMTDAFMLKANEQWGYTTAVNLYTGIGLPDFPVELFMLCLFLIVYCLVLIFIKIDRYTTFFAVSALISTFIAKGSNPPFGYLFTWAWFNIPFFSVLRAASRWNGMTVFSHAFFVSILVSHLVTYVQAKRAKTDGQFISITLKTHEDGSERKFFVSSSLIGKTLSGIRKSLRFLSVILLICIFLSGFVADWYFLDRGLQVYTPSSEYLQPFEWIKTQPGSYKVATVGTSRLAEVSMWTDLGAGHDIGYDSYFIDDKPTLQEGDFNYRARAFVNHLQNFLVAQRLTKRLPQILGTFDYRYTVIPPYGDNATRDFFLNQEGISVAFNQSSLVLESNYSPSLFAAGKYAVVVGGLESFYSLLTIDSFNLNETALVFADQICTNATTFETVLNASEALIMVDSDPTDLLMMFLRDKSCWLNAADYGVRSLDDSKYWIQSFYWENAGKLVFTGYTLRSSGKNIIHIPFQVQTDGSYEVWIRIGFGPSQGTLGISVDKENVMEVRGHQSSESMRWLNVTMYLTRGLHTISLESEGDGFCDIDAIAIAEPSMLKSETERMIHTLQNFPGRLIYFLQAEDFLSNKLPVEWSPILSPYDGMVLHTEGIGGNIAPGGTASASSVEGFDAKYAVDGDSGTRWASAGGMPQWLEVEWNSSKSFVGAQVSFERAVAEDYVIQSWNGTQWIDEVDVKGNNELERTYIFEHPVQTDKLRIYVTKAPAFGMVSIWEFKCYSREGTPHPTGNLWIPTSGQYMIDLRFASNSYQGYLRLDAANYSTIVSCPTVNTGFSWQETGPYTLSPGNYSLAIDAVGKTALDAIILYSLHGDEATLSQKDMFTSNETPISVDYDVVNPCTYNLHVRSNQPFCLVFSEAYHQLWRINMTDLEAAHIPVYSFFNGFLINRTGEFDLTLYFEGQTYYNIGVAVTIITFVTITFLFISQSVRFKNFLRRSRRMAKNIRLPPYVMRRFREFWKRVRRGTSLALLP